MSRLAVLIDADNMAPSFAAEIFKRVDALGTPTIIRAHGRAGAIAAWGQSDLAGIFELRLHTPVNSAKNGTDIAMAIDAMDILHERAVDAFCLVSNDRDFIPLAIRLRASGKSVHAICKNRDGRIEKAFDTVFELDPTEHPLVLVFRKVAGGRPELSLSEAGKLLREHAPTLIPNSGKSPLRRSLEATGKFDLSGSGSAIRVRLRA